MSRLTAKQKKELAGPANAACRGKQKTPEHTEKIARRRERTRSKVGRFEQEIGSRLLADGFNVEPQRPIGPYNIDLFVEPIAVEVYVGTGNPLRRKAHEKRARYLESKGIRVLYVWVDSRIGEMVNNAGSLVSARLRRMRAIEPGSGLIRHSVIDVTLKSA